MRARARRICFPLSESSWVHTQNVWKRASLSVRLWSFCAAGLFDLWYPPVWSVRLAWNGSCICSEGSRHQRSVSGVALTDICGPFETATCKHRCGDRGNNKPLAGRTDDGCHDELSQDEAWWGSYALQAFPNKCQPKDQWKINMGMSNCVPTNVCLYVAHV